MSAFNDVSNYISIVSAYTINSTACIKICEAYTNNVNTANGIVISAKSIATQYKAIVGHAFSFAKTKLANAITAELGSWGFPSLQKSDVLF